MPVGKAVKQQHDTISARNLVLLVLGQTYICLGMIISLQDYLKIYSLQVPGTGQSSAYSGH